MNIMDTLLNETMTVSEWCDQIIKQQQEVVYNSLTNPRDLNHLVKDAVQSILDYLKSRGKCSMSEVNDSKLKAALGILLPYLRKHESWKPSRMKPLNDEELEKAYNDLYVDKYLMVDRKFSDPPLHGQNYAIFSFNPSNKAKPDPDGIYGFIKVRGAFNRLEEAEEKSKELIQYFSANKIFVCEVGKPTPVHDKLIDMDRVIEVDNPNKNEDVLKYEDLVKEQSIKEKQQIEEIKQREQKLKEDVTKDPTDKDPIQIYIELTQKRATCTYLYQQHEAKLEEMKKHIINARKDLLDMDEKYPNLKKEYMEHYQKTSKECGLDKATDAMAVMVRQHIEKEPDLGF